jgi:hypothetical protein
MARAEGLCEPATFRIVIELVGQIGVATNTHTSLHRATSRHKWVNEALSFIGCPLITGIRLCFWRDKHNRRHHASPTRGHSTRITTSHPSFFALSDVDFGRHHAVLTKRDKIKRLTMQKEEEGVPGRSSGLGQKQGPSR